MRHSVQVIVMILLLPMLSGCFPLGIGAPAATVPLRDLLVDTSVYPSGWEQVGVEENEYHTNDDIENISIGFIFPPSNQNVSNQYIWRFASSEAAQSGMNELLNRNQSSHPALVDSKDICGDVTYSSSVAQRMVMRCDLTIGPHPLYIVLSQYGSYISKFTVYSDNRSMSRADFNRILGEIDKKMAIVIEQ